jgi:hypothetical protein
VAQRARLGEMEGRSEEEIAGIAHSRTQAITRQPSISESLTS